MKTIYDFYIKLFGREERGKVRIAKSMCKNKGNESH
jgi:hypothetical protein